MVPSRALKEEVSHGLADVTCAFTLVGFDRPDLGQIFVESALTCPQLAEDRSLFVWPVVV